MRRRGRCVLLWRPGGERRMWEEQVCVAVEAEEEEVCGAVEAGGGGGRRNCVFWRRPGGRVGGGGVCSGRGRGGRWEEEVCVGRGGGWEDGES